MDKLALIALSLSLVACSGAAAAVAQDDSVAPQPATSAAPTAPGQAQTAPAPQAAASQGDDASAPPSATSQDSGAPAQQDPPAAQDDAPRFGVKGQAVHASLPAGWVGATDATVEAWVSYHSLGGGSEQVIDAPGVWVAYAADGTLQMLTCSPTHDSCSGKGEADALAPVAKDTFHLVTASLHAGSWCLLVDGQLQGCAKAAYEAIPQPFNPVGSSADPFLTRGLDGTLDEFRLAVGSSVAASFAPSKHLDGGCLLDEGVGASTPCADFAVASWVSVTR